MWHDNVIGDKTTVWNKLPSASSSMSMAVVSSSNEDILPQDEVDLAPQRERWRRKDFMVEDATQDVMNAKSEFYEKPRWDLKDDRIWGVQHFSKRLLSRCVTGSSRLTIPLLWRNALRMHLLMSDALFVRKFLKEREWMCHTKTRFFALKSKRKNEEKSRRRRYAIDEWLFPTSYFSFRCRGVVEWINCSLFDALLLVLEAAINLWLATSLNEAKLATEYRAIVVMLILPSIVNPLLWLRLKSQYKLSSAFILVLLVVGFPSPLFL